MESTYKVFIFLRKKSETKLRRKLTSNNCIFSFRFFVKLKTHPKSPFRDTSKNSLTLFEKNNFLAGKDSSQLMLHSKRREF